VDTTGYALTADCRLLVAFFPVGVDPVSWTVLIRRLLPGDG